MRSLQDHFLIAMPAMGDPNFDGSVIYLCQHSATQGALGVVVNRPIDMSLGSVFEQLSLEVLDERQAALPVWGGGPVERERGFVLHESDQTFESTIHCGSGIRVTMSPDVLAALARGDGPAPVLVALGYAGWRAGQLEAELAANTWLTAPADPAILFATPHEQRWAAAIGLLGVDVRQMTSYAGHA
jgi:putative transcriptional regulator